MRSVLHIRVKNFYASVECACEPRLRNVPMVVCGTTEAGKGVVISRNDMAGALGVMKGQTVPQAVLKCHGLFVLPPDFNKYLNFASRIRAICADYTDLIEAFSMDELYLDVSACHTHAMDLALALHKRAREELGLTLQIGLSFNKAFARMASDVASPNATMAVTPENFRQKLWPRSARELMYVNAYMQRKLNELRIYTIQDLASADEKLLSDALGVQGYMLREFAQGNDISPVWCQGLTAPTNSIGDSIATLLALRRDSDVEQLMQLLAAGIAECLCKLGLRGDGIFLEVVDCEHSAHCYQKKIARPSASAEDIMNAARSLFRENWCWCKPVHSLKLSVSPLNLPDGCMQPKLIPNVELRRCELEDTVGNLRRRFGHAIISRASLLRNDTANVIRSQLA